MLRLTLSAVVGILVPTLIAGAVMAGIALATDPSHPAIGDYGQGLLQWTSPLRVPNNVAVNLVTCSIRRPTRPC